MLTTIRMSSLVYLTEPVECPPTLPVPAASESAADMMEMNENQNTLGSNMGQTFAAFSAFWTIAREIIPWYRPNSGPQVVPLAFALSKYQKLLTWADSLSQSMARGEHSPAHVVVFQ